MVTVTKKNSLLTGKKEEHIETKPIGKAKPTHEIVPSVLLRG